MTGAEMILRGSVIFYLSWCLKSVIISLFSCSDCLVSSVKVWGHTYIDRQSSYQFVFSSSWDHTYINQSYSCRFEFESGLHLYRSIIVLSVWVWISVFRTAPISIGHRLIRLSLSSWDRTYIDQSFILSV